MAIFNKKLGKTVGEIRYRPTIGSTSGAVNFGKILEDSFPHWRIQNGQDIALFDEKKKILIQIRYNSLLFINEGEDENAETIELLKTVYEKIVETAGIKEFLHIGCRKQIVFESTFQIQDLIDLTFRKFYGNTEKLKSISGNKTRDTAFILDGVRDGFNTHVQIGPATIEQATKFFKGQFVDTELNESKAYLLMDTDVFKKESVTAENGVDLLTQVEKLCLAVQDSYIDFLSEK